MNKQPQILLLTATITPPTYVPNLVRTDPKIRLLDYESALAFYLTLIGNGLDYIVFTDNSDSDLSTLQRLVDQSEHADSVELLRFYGLDYPSDYGRGYGEFKLVNYAITNSQIIQSLNSEPIVWKVTGRYQVRNLTDVINQQPEKFDIYCNFRLGFERPLYNPTLLNWMDLYVVAWSSKGYQEVIKEIYKELRESKDGAPEKRFAQLLEQTPPDITVIPRFKTVPFIDGVRGFDGQNFSKGIHLWKYYMRRIAQRLAPWLWI